MSTIVKQPVRVRSRVVRFAVLGLSLLVIGAVVGAWLTGLMTWPFRIDVPFLGLMPMLLKGVWITVALTVLGAILALLIALLVGIARTSPIWIVRYVEFFRGTSILVQMFWIYFVLPALHSTPI